MFIEERQEFHWRQAKRNKQEVNICTKLLFGTLLISAVASTPVLAAPAGGVVTDTGPGIEATISTPTPTDPGITHETRIDQNKGRIDIDWTGGFDTSSTELVRFVQPHNLAVAINRVTNGTRTTFNGFLTANGQVFLINRHGITFGATSQVNVGALLATTSNPDNLPTFLADGGPLQFNGSDYATIINDGNISIAPGGFAVLAAPYVENNGNIQADSGVIPDTDGAEGNQPQYFEGHVQLASTQDFELRRGNRGDNLVVFDSTPETLDGGEGGEQLAVTNTGMLRSRSGNVYLRSNITGIGAKTVNLSGIIDADALATDPETGGKILVTSVTDINIGDADIHAIGGNKVRGIFKANDDIVSNPETSFSINLKATGKPGDQESGTPDADAQLTMVAGSDDLGDEDDNTGEINITGTINVTAEIPLDTDSDATANANAKFRAPDDVTLTGNTTVTADVDNLGIASGDDARANAKLSAKAGCDANCDATDNTEDWGTGNLTINGDTIVTADATLSGSYGNDANADAQTVLKAANNITVNGNASTIANALNAISGDNALAYAKQRVKAVDGNISITGNINTLADAIHSNQYGNATATASADLDANSILVTNGITVDAEAVTATADGYGTYVTANAYLDANAADGDVTIGGNITVSALADGGSYDADAYALASADVDATDDVNLGDDASDINILATAINTKPALDEANSDADSATAYAYLYVDAGNDGSGDLTISGNNILVKADVTHDGTSDAYASAYVELDAADDVTINTGTTTFKVDATAVNTGDSDDASAYAYLYVDAGDSQNSGDITINGNTEVSASATRGGEGSYQAYGYAYADLEAWGDVNIDGDVTVMGTADNTATSGSGAYAYAYLYINAYGGGETDGDLNITGDVKVISDAFRNADDDDSAYAYTSADLYAADDLSITGNVDVEAIASNDAPDADASAYGASAYAYLFAVAEDGDLTINGNDILVKADATQGANGTESAYAYASADFDAGGSVFITTDTTTLSVEANALNQSTDGYYTYAGADLEIEAGEDIVINGNSNVEATALGHDQYYGSAEVDAEAELSIIAGKSKPGGDLNITGDVTVAATATVATVSDVFAYEATADADAFALLLAQDDVNVTGDINVTATANTEESESDYAYADAGLVMLAGISSFDFNLGDLLDNPELIEEFSFSEGDVNFTGDITVKADADAVGTDDASAEAFALGLIMGGDDVNIDTDPVRVIAEADATEDGEPGGEAEAGAGLFIVALGIEGEPDEGDDGGNITIRGDVSSQANANPANEHDYFDDFPFAELAVTALFADNNIVIRGQDPLAEAGPARVQGKETAFDYCVGDATTCSGDDSLHEYFDGAEGGGTSLAQLIIEAENADIQPDESKFEEEVALPNYDRPDPIEPPAPEFPGSRPPTFDVAGNFLQSDSLAAAGEPVDPLGLEDDDPVVAGDPTTLLPPTAAGPAEAARTRTNHDRLVR